MPLINKFLNVLCVNVFSFALSVGTEITSLVWSFVPFDAKPFEGFQDCFFRAFCRPDLISIFDSENHFTQIFPGKCKVKQGHVGGAHMRSTRRRRGNSSSGSTGHFKKRDCILLICTAKDEQILPIDSLQFQDKSLRVRK